MSYTTPTSSAALSQRSLLRWVSLATSLLLPGQSAFAQTPAANGQNALLVSVASRQLSEADSTARVAHRKPAVMRLDKIEPGVPSGGFFIASSSAGTVEHVPTLASGGGLVALIKAVEQQLSSASVGKTKTRAETSVYVTLTISAEGKVQQTKIAAGQDAATNAAVLAAIQRLPRLLPGKVAGTAVPVKLTIPVLVNS